MGGMEPVARAVEQPSFEELHRAHVARIRRLCRLLLRDPDEAEDTAQDVLLRLLRAQQLERLSAPAWARWLTRVTVNACRDRRRSGWWRWWRDARSGARPTDDFAIDGPTPEELVVGVETRRRIWTAYRQLSRRQQEIFALRHVEGFTTAEAAAALGVSEGSAKRHLYRAVQQLRAALGGLR